MIGREYTWLIVIMPNLTNRVQKSVRIQPLRSFIFPVMIVLLVILAQTSIAPPSGDWRDRALEYADMQHMFGPIHLTAAGSTSTYSGSFLTFQFTNSTAMITDYIVLTPGKTNPMFQSITPDVASTGTIILNGSIFEYTSTMMHLTLYNNPTSAIIIKPMISSLNVTFTLASGVDARRFGESLNLTSTFTGLKGRLLVTNDANLNLLGNQAFVEIPSGSSAIFRTNSVAGENVAGADGQDALANATVGGLLGLESFEVGFEGYVESSDVVYNDINRVDTNISSDNVIVTFNVGISLPKIVVFHFHRSMMDIDNKTSFMVQLDGMNITKLPHPNEILNYSGITPAYVSIVGLDGLLMLLHIQQQGSFTLAIEKISSPPPESLGLNPIFILGMIAIILVIIGIAAVFMFRRKSLS